MALDSNDYKRENENKFSGPEWLVSVTFMYVFENPRMVYVIMKSQKYKLHKL